MISVVSRPHISLLLCGVGLLLAFALAPVVFPSPLFRVAMGDLIPLLVIVAASIVSARNAFDSRGHTRLFWSLMTAGMAMWGFNQACWVWLEVVVRKPLPDPFQGISCCSCTLSPSWRQCPSAPRRRRSVKGCCPAH